MLNSKIDINAQNVTQLVDRTSILETANVKLNGLLKQALDRLTDVEATKKYTSS